MAKPPGPGKCVHCLRDPVERNWDHVFPESWYPDTTPPNLFKWRIPSCIPCNDSLGIMEEDLFIRLAHVLDPCHPGSSGLYERARRAIDPEAGKDDGDRKARAATRKRFLETVMVGEAIPDHGVYPGLEDRWNQPPSDRMAITVSKQSMERITEKIVRGIFYLEEGGAFVEPPYKIEFFALGSEGAVIVRKAIDRFGKEYAREPGIVVRRAIADDSKSALFEIEFFQQFKTHASVTADEIDSK